MYFFLIHTGFSVLFQRFSVFNWRVADEIKGFTVSRCVLTADCRWQCRHVIHIEDPSDSLLTRCRLTCKNLSNDSLFSGACVTKRGRGTENGWFSDFFLSYFLKFQTLFQWIPTQHLKGNNPERKRRWTRNCCFCPFCSLYFHSCDQSAEMTALISAVGGEITKSGKTVGSFGRPRGVYLISSWRPRGVKNTPETNMGE